ncbi:hypothetical protein AWB71_05277 [Caballeronia peredens]|nr:hypothetical protein AWB71_05277 [Caballeronia peredens]
MNLSQATIQKLADFTCGGSNGWPYRSGPELVALFNRYGFKDTYPFTSSSRTAFAREKLTELATKEAMGKFLCDLISPANWIELRQPELRQPELRQPELHTPKECLDRLNALLAFDNYEIVAMGNRGIFHKVQFISGSLVTVDSMPKSLPEFTATSIEEQIIKCRQKIDSEDYDGAITNARTLVEHMLLAIEEELSEEPPPQFDGDLSRLFNRVRSLLNLSASRKDISESLKQVLTGLASIVTGLAAMRNKMSDSHGKTYRPERHHAKLAVNSAKTLAEFLFETVDYQRKKGLLKPSTPPSSSQTA